MSIFIYEVALKISPASANGYAVPPKVNTITERHNNMH